MDFVLWVIAVILVIAGIFAPMPTPRALAPPRIVIDLTRRRLRFEERDPPFELGLLLEQVEQDRVVGVAVFAQIAELLAHLLATYRPQRLKLST
jgi:hypothetical protein